MKEALKRSARLRLNRRGRKLIRTLYQKYEERFGTYRHHNVETGPQNLNMPGGQLPGKQLLLGDKNRITILPHIARGSRKHVQWLFFATLTDRRQVSMEVYRAHVKIFAEHPEWYTEAVIGNDPAAFGEELNRYRIGVPRQSASYWIRCAKTLFEEFGGDPLLIVKCAKGTVAGVQKWKAKEEKKRGRGYDPLPGYGPKITSLFLTYMAELGLYPMPKDAFPVDRHVQALFIQYEALRIEGGKTDDDLEAILRSFICKVAHDEGMDLVALSHAFWQLGRTSCTKCYAKKSVALHCPIESECLGPVDSKSYWAKGKWEPIFLRKGSERVFRIAPGPLFEDTA